MITDRILILIINLSLIHTIIGNKSISSDPILRFGVITDVHYADFDDLPSWYDANNIRYYRTSLRHIKKAFNYWINGCSDDYQPSFILHLGYVSMLIY